MSMQVSNNVQKLAIVQPEFPKLRCPVSLRLTPSHDKYSHDEMTLSGICLGLASDVRSFSSPLSGIVWLAMCFVFVSETALPRHYVGIRGNHQEAITVLPYLGPELIAAILEACSPASRNLPSSSQLASPGKSEDRIIPSMLLSIRSKVLQVNVLVHVSAPFRSS
jgi:hypothetical protein